MPCREPNVGGPIVLGSETLRAFGSAYWFGPVTKMEGPWLGPVFTTMFLTYLAVLLWRAGKDGKQSLLRSLMVYYILVTAFVEVTRFVWDVSRFALVWAALHNLAEWGIICYTLFSDVSSTPAGSDEGSTQPSKAFTAWWWSQLWILLVANWVIFAPSLMEAGLGEQVAGLTCDWLLLIVWTRLWYLAGPKERAYLRFGVAGAFMHMAEILPLVSLLVGLVPSPWLPGCILISISTPLTYFFYSCMVNGWDADKNAKDLVCTHDKSKAKSKLQLIRGNSETGCCSNLQAATMIFIALLLSCATLFTPVLVFPSCTAAGMKVPPGAQLQPLPALTPGTSAFTNTTNGLPLPGNLPVTTSAASYTSSFSAPASNETLCPSNTKLTGTTTVWAKPGAEQKLFNMVATMPGPVRAEDGNRYYEIALGGPKGDEVKFFESWTSIRSLYKHVYTSPAVASVFHTEAFAAAAADTKLEGPFKAMIPCTEAQAEARPVSIPFQFTMDAPIDVVWAKIDDWSHDHSWVQGSQGVTAVTPNLRILHFKTTDVLVIRQTMPLPPVDQPAGGHRLIYHMLTGGFLDTIGEAYQGDLTVMPSTQHPGKTIFTYQATVTAKAAKDTGTFENLVQQDFQHNRIPFLAQWAREAADAASISTH